VHCAQPSAEAVAELAAMVAALDGLESRPNGVFVVGCGVDIVPIKRQLDAMLSIPVSAPEEPDMALARGAALASANAPLFASSTAALAYAQDPGTGEVIPDALAPAYLDISANARLRGSALAYSAVADEEEDEGLRAHRPFLLAGSGLAAVFLIGIVALLISLAADVGPIVGQGTGPRGNVVPTKQLPAPPAAQAPAVAAPAPSAPPAAPPPPAPPSAAPSPPPETITAPTPVVHQAPEAEVTPPPVRRAPTQQAPVYAPPPAAPPPPPAAPPPPPALPAPQMPPLVMYLRLPFVTVPIPINPPPPPPPGP
jgi:hypothetical protein